MMKIYIQCAFFCLPQDELLGETDSLLPPKLGAELLNFLTKVLASLGQIPKQHNNEDTGSKSTGTSQTLSFLLDAP